METITNKQRGLTNYENDKKEKWIRSIKKNDGKIVGKEVVEERGRKKVDYVSNPTNYRARAHTESPPPKSKRTKRGINKGKPGACSFCRPKIAIYMTNKASIRKHMLDVNKDINMIDE